MNFITAAALGALLLITKISRDGPAPVEAAYTNLFNQTGCLYAYMSDGKYEVVVPESTDVYRGPLQKFTYDPKSTCITKNSPGSLIINFDIQDDKFISMNLELKLQGKDHDWGVNEAKLTILPVSGQLFTKMQFQLQPTSGDIYADFQQSYSCSSLVLEHREKSGLQFKITLRRFQVQPFHEPSSTVFAPSRDCSSWLTLPQIMGFLLILFIAFTVLIGVHLLLELGSHSSDLRFSKQGGMLMNQAQLDATKAD